MASLEELKAEAAGKKETAASELKEIMKQVSDRMVSGRKLHEAMEESMSHLFEGLKVTIVGDETVLYCVCYEIVCVVLSCSLLFVFSLFYPLHSPTILTSILPFCHFPSSILIPFSNSSIP